MADSPFGPVQKGLVGNRARDPRRVINFPDKEWRDQFHALRKSTDPLDVAIYSNNQSLMREVDMRTDAARAKKKQRSLKNVAERAKGKFTDAFGLE